MASHTVAVFDWSGRSQTETLNQLRNNPTDKRASIHKLSKMMLQLMTGNLPGGGTFRVQHSSGASVRASQTATVVQASLVDATDTLVSFGVTLTAKTTPTTENHFAIGSTNAEAATNLKNAINAHSTLSKYVVASVSSNVVTVTVLMPGAFANFIPITETGNGITLGGTVYASGAGMAYATVDSFTW
jgi:hypothetical protein